MLAGDCSYRPNATFHLLEKIEKASSNEKRSQASCLSGWCNTHTQWVQIKHSNQRLYLLKGVRSKRSPVSIWNDYKVVIVRSTIHYTLHRPAKSRVSISQARRETKSIEK